MTELELLLVLVLVIVPMLLVLELVFMELVLDPAVLVVALVLVHPSPRQMMRRQAARSGEPVDRLVVEFLSTHADLLLQCLQ